MTSSTPDDVDKHIVFVAHNMADVSSSRQYLRSRQELLEDCELPLNDEQWRVPVCIDLDYTLRGGGELEVLMLKSTVAIAKSLAQVEEEQRAVTVVERPLFAVREVSSVLLSKGRLTPEGLTQLQKLAQLGVRIGNFTICVMTCPRWKAQDEMKQIVEALWYLTAQVDDDDGRTNSGFRSPWKRARVREVEIDLYEEEDEEYDDEEGEDRGGDWEWIAYHLFSRFASHNANTLRLNLRDLQATEVDAIRNLLEDKNPLARLDGRPDECNDEQPQIVASRFCVLYPGGFGGWMYEDESVDHKNDKYMYTTPAPVIVRVISKPVAGEGPWWLVVLPGQGFAWVHEEGVISFVLWSSEDDALTRPTLPTIMISDLSSDSENSSVDLLTLIGQGTSRVELHKYEDDAPLDEWCGSVLGACPQLEELHLLAGMMETLQVFVAAAEVGQCRLRELKVQYVEPSETDHAVAFFTALSNPLHPLTKPLQQLDLNFIMSSGINLAEIVESTIRMLEMNRLLQHVHLIFQGLEDAEAHKATIDRAFQSQLEAKVAIRVTPLGLSSKLAFLSVVDQQVPTGGAMSRLDSGVMEGIFEFAAVARTRLLQVVVPIFP